ncbi:hypothetical protein B0T25DRAFT_529878 [Lasiosphaeria hispida]|uniref:Uncharacterized protein n=1 Tax=Lasiosphaeria hispida TaxID=260671 RepID=A0AAJ0ML06_9PEZI|nr:hypothetical protein B0T25DRAFT_529878 [Lasiosphaeria hispida]
MSASDQRQALLTKPVEDVELSDLANSTAVASSSQQNGSNQSGDDGDLELDEASSSYLQLLQRRGEAPNQGHESEYRVLWASLSPGLDDEENRCRVLIHSSDSGSHSSPKMTECVGVRRLSEVLNDTASAENRLVVLEDLSLRHMCVLGSRLRIHPSVFARHFIHLRFGTLHSDNLAAFLASDTAVPSTPEALRPEPHNYNLRYFDILPKDPGSYGKASPLQSWMKRHKDFPNADFAAFNILRRVFIPPKTASWDVDGEVVTVQSKLSVWKNPDSGQTIVLVDPTIRDPKFLRFVNGSTSTDMETSQIRFADHPAQELGSPAYLGDGPAMSVSSHLFSDIKNLPHPAPDSDRMLVFLRRYVIHKWIVYLNHVHRCLASVRDTQSVRSMEPGGGWSEDMFVRGLKYWSEFLPIVQLTIEANMAALGIDISESSSVGVGGVGEANMWRYIHRMLGNYAKMFERVADSYTQIVAIKEAQSSTLQAQASSTQAQFVGRLTLLGTLFLPASLVAGILSMGGEFLPGQRLFWVYIAVLIPVLFLVVLILFTDLGTLFIPDPVSLGMGKDKHQRRSSGGKRSEKESGGPEETG